MRPEVRYAAPAGYLASKCDIGKRSSRLRRPLCRVMELDCMINARRSLTTRALPLGRQSVG